MRSAPEVSSVLYQHIELFINVCRQNPAWTTEQSPKNSWLLPIFLSVNTVHLEDSLTWILRYLISPRKSCRYNFESLKMRNNVRNETKTDENGRKWSKSEGTEKWINFVEKLRWRWNKKINENGRLIYILGVPWWVKLISGRSVQLRFWALLFLFLVVSLVRSLELGPSIPETESIPRHKKMCSFKSDQILAILFKITNFLRRSMGTIFSAKDVVAAICTKKWQRMAFLHITKQ